MGAKIDDYLSKKVTHIFAMNSNALLQKLDHERLMSFEGVSCCYSVSFVVIEGFLACLTINFPYYVYIFLLACLLA